MVKPTNPRSKSQSPNQFPIGRTFLRILKGSFDASRLSRGREIYEQGRVLEIEGNAGTVISRIKGRPRPYRDQGGPPIYEARIRFEPLPESDVFPVLDEIGTNVGLAARLVSHDLCWHDERPLPTGFESSCSCPDERNPCKHIAALCYMLARRLDRNPLVLFELRGISKDVIEERLDATPLGRVVLDALSRPLPRPEHRAHFFEYPESQEAPTTMRPSEYFGRGPAHRLPPLPVSAAIPGILPRKGGDYPGFWESDEPFTRVMDAFYAELRRRLTSVI
jgi:uncharacterized Zn finger protein